MPRLLKEEIEANIPRQARFREQVRHGANYVSGLIVSFAAGIIFGGFTALIDALIQAISRFPYTFGIGFLVFFITCFLAVCRLVFALKQPITFGVMGGIAVGALCLGALAALLAAIIHGLLLSHQRDGTDESGADGDAPRAVVIGRAGEE